MNINTQQTHECCGKGSKGSVLLWCEYHKKAFLLAMFVIPTVQKNCLVDRHVGKSCPFSRHDSSISQLLRKHDRCAGSNVSVGEKERNQRMVVAEMAEKLQEIQETDGPTQLFETYCIYIIICYINGAVLFFTKWCLSSSAHHTSRGLSVQRQRCVFCDMGL